MKPNFLGGKTLVGVTEVMTARVALMLTDNLELCNDLSYMQAIEMDGVFNTELINEEDVRTTIEALRKVATGEVTIPNQSDVHRATALVMVQQFDRQQTAGPNLSA